MSPSTYTWAITMKHRPPTVLLACSAAALLACGCQQSLFDKDFAPTDVQIQEAGPGPQGQLMLMDDGTNQDPTVDNPDYPLEGGAPAYAQPGNAPGT